MKHIKKYEYYKNYNDVKVGDFVILDTPDGSGLPKYACCNIGEVTDIINDNLIYIKYENFPSLTYIHKSWIKFKSKNKEDIKIILLQNKYNI